MQSQVIDLLILFDGADEIDNFMPEDQTQRVHVVCFRIGGILGPVFGLELNTGSR